MDPISISSRDQTKSTAIIFPQFQSLHSQTEASLYWGLEMIGYHASRLQNLSQTCNQSSTFFGLTREQKAGEDTVYFNTFLTPEQIPSRIDPGNSSKDSDNNTFLLGGYRDVQSLESWSLTSGIDLLAQYKLGWENSWSGFVPLSNTSEPLESYLLLMDGLVKSLYATIQAHLGQPVLSNIVADPQRLIEFVNASMQFDPLTRNALDHDVAKVLHMLFGLPPVTRDAILRNPEAFYQLFKTGVPVVKPAVLNAQYLCQVPKIKNAGSLIVSIIVADLVFLQVLWKILNWTIVRMVEWRYPQANYCAGCKETASMTVVGNDEDGMTKISFMTTRNSENVG
ncbi:hypothetical protein EPUS_07827 [Endocarpon pusillum Z07020]|uniref:Uncharacterized protein n=1 Tax=Endocarpon pusillum (strain Z07020 / HMAS-L-300199) TaxID=1263415 RepID=U1GPT1_ENDPU|nr:uncharacterized protein EPUS_07827 [Endocarpon pusillum Z07020]ERF73976.1 hypothetical protein EPUS_07827 [Endocarpon pusillum Z07020]